MSTPYTDTNFGASVVPTQHRTYAEGELQPPAMLDSPALTPAGSHEDMSSVYTEKTPSPQSHFNKQPVASYERIHAYPSSKNNTTTYEKDLESGHVTPITMPDDPNPFTNRVDLDNTQECKMWPSRQTLMQQKTQEKTKQRQMKGLFACAPLRERWAALNKKQRLYTKIAVAILLIGIAVALGVGISKAVHGTYYGNHGQQENVGGS